MSCDTLEDAIVNVARGRDVGAGTAGAVEAHIEHCTSCRARFMRELQLTDGLRELARSTDSQSASAVVEMRVLAAFAHQHERHTNGGWPAGMRVAAALALLAASGAAGWGMVGRSRVEDVRHAAIEISKPIQSLPTPSPALEARAPTVAAASPMTGDLPRRRGAGAVRRSASRVVRPEGFVALPSATGLPAFESGEILRLEVPVTSLPMYGIDIAPDARGPVVEADFLVGQDGQARAIRLVKDGRL